MITFADSVTGFLARYGDPSSPDYSEHVYVSAEVSPGFGAHVAACLSEGACPAGHRLTDGKPPFCLSCEPSSIWIAENGGWAWERLDAAGWRYGGTAP